MARLRCKGWEMKGWISVILLLLQIMLCLNSSPQVSICYTGANPYIYALQGWLQSGMVQLIVKTKSPPYLPPALSLYHNFLHFLWLIINPVDLRQMTRIQKEGKHQFLIKFTSQVITCSWRTSVGHQPSDHPALLLPACTWAPRAPHSLCCSHMENGDPVVLAETQQKREVMLLVALRWPHSLQREGSGEQLGYRITPGTACH